MKIIRPFRSALKRLFCVLFSLLTAAFLPLSVFAVPKSSDPVRVARFTMGSYYSVTSGGEVISYDTEYLDRISEYAGFSYVYVDCGTWSEAIAKLEAHEVDLVGTMQSTEARRNTYAMCDVSYGFSVTELISLPGSDYIYGDETNRKDARFGCVGDYARLSEVQKYLQDHGYESNIMYFKTQERLLSALRTGIIDIAAVGAHTVTDEFKVVKKFNYYPFYFASWKGNEALTAKIDNAITVIHATEPQLDDALAAKYLSQVLFAPLSAKELALLSEDKEYHVYFDDETRPIAWYDQDTGTMRGILPDLLQKLSENTGLRLVPLPFSSYSGRPAETDVFYRVAYNETGNDYPAYGLSASVCNMDYELYYKVSRSIDLSSGSAYTIGVSENRPELQSYLRRR